MKRRYQTPYGNFLFAQAMEQDYIKHPAIVFPPDDEHEGPPKKGNSIGTKFVIAILVIAIIGAVVGFLFHIGALKI